jgi:hypothetical protein
VTKLKPIEVVDIMQSLNSQTILKLKPKVSGHNQRLLSSKLSTQKKFYSNPYSNSPSQADAS